MTASIFFLTRAHVQYRTAKVVQRRHGTFYYVALVLSSECRIARWISREMFIRKIA